MATVKLTEIYKQNRFTDSNSEKYKIRPVHINPDFVVCLREDAAASRMLEEGLFPSGLDPRQEFTKIHLNGGHGSFDITVVGSPDIVENKLACHKQVLLKG